MPEYNSIRSYKRQIFNNYQFLLNSAIRLIFNSQITLSLGTVQHPAVSQRTTDWLCFRGRKAEMFRIPLEVPKREGHPNSAADCHPLRLRDVTGARAGPTFPFTTGKCPMPLNCSIHHPQEKPEVKSFTCVLQSTLQLEIILHASSHLFAELKHTLGINRSL